MVSVSRFERAFVDALDEPAFVVGSGVVQNANRAARRLFGNQIEGRDLRLVIRHPQALEHILGGRDADVDVTGIGGHEYPWRVSVRDAGQGRAIVRMIDRSAAVAAERMRVDFVANASHELRTPLATILGYAETLTDHDALSAEDRTVFAGTIRAEAGRMLRIIEDLMSLSRIEAERFVSPGESVSIADIVETARANVGHSRNAAECEMTVNLEPNLPPVRGDRGQLIQLLDNLLGNALRYGCDGPNARIEIVAERSGRAVALSVADHGPGIPREHLPRITERFYRVDAARSRESGGTGLGLAIVKHIVERHRGELSITSSPGAGTRVRIRLPVAS